MKYKITKELKDYLKGFRYKVNHSQDEMHQIIVYVKKSYLNIGWFKSFMNYPVVYADKEFIKVIFYSDFDKIGE